MKFLHIDDNPDDRLLVKALIGRTRHWEYLEASSVQDGLRAWQRIDPQVVLIDLSFPNKSENEAYEAIRSMSKTTCVIALSGDDSWLAADKSRDAGASAFINKNSLNDPESFHQSMLNNVDKNLHRVLSGGTLSAELQELIRRLADAVLYGNGKPSMMTRLALGDERMGAMEEKIDLIRNDQIEVKASLKEYTDNTVWHRRLIIFIMLINVVFAAWGIYTKQKIEPVSIPVEMDQGK